MIREKNVFEITCWEHLWVKSRMFKITRWDHLWAESCVDVIVRT